MSIINMHYGKKIYIKGEFEEFFLQIYGSQIDKLR